MWQYCLYKVSLKKRTVTVPYLSFPSYSPPSLRYNITHSSNIDFYLGITHLFKKIISNFMLLERPLSLKLIFHNYNQLIDREIELYEWAMYLLFLFFFFCCWFVFVSCFLFFFFLLLLFFQHIALSSSFFFFLYASVCSGLFFFFLFFLFSGGLVFSLIISVETQSVTISWRYVWFLAPN